MLRLMARDYPALRGKRKRKIDPGQGRKVPPDRSAGGTLRPSARDGQRQLHAGVEAAKDLGASEVTILRKIILPLAMPAVAAGWLLSFTLSMDDVVVSSFVTGPSYEILPLKIYSMVKVGVSPEVNALATILLVFSLVLVIASQVIARDKTKSQGTMK